MRLLIKQNVQFKELTPQALRVFDCLLDIGDLIKVDITITSANDSVHGENSLHYKDRAWDIRTKDLSVDKADRLLFELKGRLKAHGFDVVDERGKKEGPHIHVEYDPK